MLTILDNDYIMKFKNEKEIRAHLKRFTDLKEVEYTESALSSDLSHYALERNFSEIDYQLVVEKYGRFHNIICEILNRYPEKVDAFFWSDVPEMEKLEIEDTIVLLRRLDNIAGIFSFLLEHPPKSYKEELIKIFKLQQDLNIHLGTSLGEE